jgi:hypothetical protein
LGTYTTDRGRGKIDYDRIVFMQAHVFSVHIPVNRRFTPLLIFRFLQRTGFALKVQLCNAASFVTR